MFISCKRLLKPDPGTLTVRSRERQPDQCVFFCNQLPLGGDAMPPPTCASGDAVPKWLAKNRIMVLERIYAECPATA